jgi:hypothetical protein
MTPTTASPPARLLLLPSDGKLWHVAIWISGSSDSEDEFANEDHEATPPPHMSLVRACVVVSRANLGVLEACVLFPGF